MKALSIIHRETDWEEGVEKVTFSYVRGYMRSKRGVTHAYRELDQNSWYLADGKPVKGIRELLQQC